MLWVGVHSGALRHRNYSRRTGCLGLGLGAIDSTLDMVILVLRFTKRLNLVSHPPALGRK